MRVTLLFLGCMATWVAGWAGAVAVADALELVGTVDLAVRAAGSLAGFAAAGLLMVTMRGFITPSRASG